MVHDFNREALATEVDLHLPAKRIIRVLDRVAMWRENPESTEMLLPYLSLIDIKLDGELDDRAASHKAKDDHALPVS